MSIYCSCWSLLYSAAGQLAADSINIVPFTSIIMHELIHRGTFKLVHRAKLHSTDIAVKRLTGE